MSDDTTNPKTRVVAIRVVDCPKDEDTAHVDRIRLENGDELSSEDTIALMDAGRNFFMIPPPGAPAYEAHIASGGLPLIIQTKACEHCQERILFA